MTFVLSSIFQLNRSFRNLIYKVVMYFEKIPNTQVREISHLGTDFILFPRLDTKFVSENNSELIHLNHQTQQQLQLSDLAIRVQHSL